MADRFGAHRLVDLAGIRHLAAPLPPVRVEQDLEGFLRRIIVIPTLLHPSDPLDDPPRGFPPFFRPPRVLDDFPASFILLVRKCRPGRAHDDTPAPRE